MKRFDVPRDINMKPMDEIFDVPNGQRQLFLDDVGVSQVRGLVRTIHPLEKKGAVIEPDAPREHAVSLRCAPAWVPEDRCYKLWLNTSAGMAYAESSDGLHWQRPALRCRECGGSLENSLVAGPCGSRVVYDPFDPDASRRYKAMVLRGCSERMVSPDGASWRMLYPQGHVLADPSQYQLSWIIQVREHPDAPADERFQGWGRYQTQDITVSADGIHWRKLECPGLPSGDEANLSHDRQAGIFIATLKVGEMTRYCRSISLATSHDFEHWTKPELVFHTDDEDQESARTIIAEHLANDSLYQPAHNVPAEYMADVYNMGVFRYEGLYLGMPEIFYHTGNTNFNSDGFISLDAGKEEGTLLTEPLILKSPWLCVNVNAAGGSFEAELLDGEGHRVAVSESESSDHLRLQVRWSEDDAEGFVHRSVRLRFSLRQASFYSYWFEERPETPGR